MLSRPCRKRRPSAREDGGVSGVPSRGTPRVPAPLPQSPFSPPDRDTGLLQLRLPFCSQHLPGPGRLALPHTQLPYCRSYLRASRGLCPMTWGTCDSVEPPLTGASRRRSAGQRGLDASANSSAADRGPRTVLAAKPSWPFDPGSLIKHL